MKPETTRPADGRDAGASALDTVGRTFDAYAGSYREAVDGSIAFSGLRADLFARIKAEHLLDLLQRTFGATNRLRLLDVGCGTGTYHPLLLPHVGALAAVDVSAESVAVARQRQPEVDCRAYDGIDLPFADGTFDVAFTICVMHHVPPSAWPAFLAEMRRVVRPGGMVLAFEHNPLNPLTRRAVAGCAFDEGAVLLRASTTSQLMREAGLEQPVTQFVAFLPITGKLARRFERLLGELPLGAQYLVAARR